MYETISCSFLGGVDDVSRGVVDPLNVYFCFGVMVIDEGKDVVGVKVVHASDVDSLPDRFQCRILGVDGWDHVCVVGDLRA